MAFGSNIPNNEVRMDTSEFEKMLPYDAVEWHLNDNYPSSLSPDNARTHIGIYLTWLIEQRMMSDEFEHAHADLLAQCREHAIKGSEILRDCCNDTLSRDLLSPQGQEFSDSYYVDSYVSDFVDTLDDESYPSIFNVPDDWASYKAMSEVLTRAYQSWLAGDKLDHSAAGLNGADILSNDPNAD